MRVKHISIWICEACLDGKGKECHTPGCALFLHAVDLAIDPALYTVLNEYDELDDHTSTQIKKLRGKVAPDLPSRLSKLSDELKDASDALLAIDLPA